MYQQFVKIIPVQSIKLKKIIKQSKQQERHDRNFILFPHCQYLPERELWTEIIVTLVPKTFAFDI